MKVVNRDGVWYIINKEELNALKNVVFPTQQAVRDYIEHKKKERDNETENKPTTS